MFFLLFAFFRGGVMLVSCHSPAWLLLLLSNATNYHIRLVC